MAGVALIPVLLVGLFGSVHCGAMCGGIVAAFSSLPAGADRQRGARPASPGTAQPASPGTAQRRLQGTALARPFPLPVSTLPAVRTGQSVLRVLAYNAGRLTSYALAGALAAGLAGEAGRLAAIGTFQQAGYWLANLMLVALGLYLMGAWRGLEWFELAGQHLWRRLRPAMRWLMPLDSPVKMLGLGLLWGWLPCGMVYSMLVTAMLSGSAASGAAVMLAFGLGTLPMLLALGLAGERLRGVLRMAVMRRSAGLVVLGFGLVGLARAAAGHDGGWLSQLCVGA